MSLVNNMVMVAIVPAVFTFLNQLVIKLVLHPERIREKMEKLKSFRMERTAAIKLKDHKLLKKLDKQQTYISQINQEVSSFQLKMNLISMAIMLSPFFLLGYIIPMGEIAGYLSTSLYGGNDRIALNFFYWYAICALFFSSIFRKALRIQV
ncbi:MAG: EMC3/TMCO1 family protein [Thermoproteota archaeon]